LLVLAPGASGALEQSGAACPSSTKPAVVTAVDATGDLVLADGSVLRLAALAVASPDEKARTAFAVHLREAVAGREVVVAMGEPASDRYGRLAGIVTIAGAAESIQQRLLHEGLAVARPEPGYLGCMDGLLAAERPARDARRGLWARLPLDAHDAAAVSAQNGRFTIIAGRIVGVGQGRTLDYLNFGRAIRHDTTLRLGRESRAALEASGVTLDSLAGRQVSARGVVFEAGGPAIDIRDIEQFER